MKVFFIPFQKFTVPMKICNKTYNISIHMIPKILNKTKINPIWTGTLETGAVPNRGFNLFRTKQLNKNHPLPIRQGAKVQVCSSGTIDINLLKMIWKVHKNNLPDMKNTFDPNTTHTNSCDNINLLPARHGTMKIF